MQDTLIARAKAAIAKADSLEGEFTKMSERAGAAEVRENVLLARVAQLEHAMKRAIEAIKDRNYDSAVGMLTTAVVPKKKVD